MAERSVRLIIAVLLTGAIAACSAPQRPDFRRLYGGAVASPDDTPVILIPGLFGSKLRDRRSGVEVWPGNWRRVLFSDHGDLALVFDPVTLEVRRDDLEASEFGGDCTLTRARILIEQYAGLPRTRLTPRAVRGAVARDVIEAAMLEPGDGRVTKPSLLARDTVDPTAPQHEESFLPVAYHFFLCEQHHRLTGNVNFQDNLLNVLLTPNLPWESSIRP